MWSHVGQAKAAKAKAAAAAKAEGGEKKDKKKPKKEETKDAAFVNTTPKGALPPGSLALRCKSRVAMNRMWEFVGCYCCYF